MPGRLASTCLALLLAGCGGGVWIGFEFGGDDDDPPHVTISASPDTVASGEAIFLEASASDDSGFVDQVDFFRVAPGGDKEFLGSDLSRPYQLESRAPQVETTTSVQYFARAFDGFGQRRDSGAVTVTVRP